jgi:tripartite-type tricarboxylate transporter receptor subunit TctC
VFGPAALPQPLLGRLNGDMVKAIQTPELRARAAEEGFEIVGNSPKEFSATLRKQYELIGRIAKAANIRPSEH